jgi:uncharacterized protein (DUF983 family)
MEKGFKYSILKSKCPRCNQGELWEKKNSYSIGFDKMHERCSECGVKYDMEQGFWYGAMYISYAMGVAVTVAIVIAAYVLTDWEMWHRVIAAAVGLFLLIPIIFRYSRNIWLAIFVRYEGENAIEEFKLKQKETKNDESNH